MNQGVKLLSAGFFLFSATFSFAQTFKGHVADKNTSAPLPYASLGVKGKSIGTVADSQGDFTLDLSKASSGDSIIISYMGYTSKAFKKGDIAETFYNVALTPATYQLQEFTVYNKRETFTIGNKTSGHRYTGWGFNTSSMGRARGLIIAPEKYPVKAIDFVMRINDNTFDSVRFRLSVEEGREGSGKQLLKENVSFTTSKNNDWIHVNVEPYNIIISDTILVYVEWIDAWGKERTVGQGSHLLTLSLSPKNGYFYRRETSQEPGELTKNDTSPAMYFEVTRVAVPGKSKEK